MIPPLAGVVLAGGRSTRMGHDKAVLRIGGRRMVDIVVAVLEAVCTEVVVATGPRMLDDLDVAQVPDSGREGPLGGIVAGLEAVSTDLAAVVAVDMPLADSRLLLDCAARWSGEPAVVPRANGVLQPLHALYATAALDHLRAALRAGRRSATLVVLDLGALVVDVDEDAFARNLNRPADLGAAEPNG